MNPNLRHTLKAILLPKTPQFLIILFLLFLTTGLQTLSPWPFKILLDNVLGKELLDSTTPLGLILAHLTPASAGAFVVFLYLGITFLSRISDYIYASYNNYVIQRVTRDFATTCFHNLTLLDYSYFRHHSIGNFLYKLDSDTTAPGQIMESALFPLITSAIYLVITFTILANMNLAMATITLVALPILSISYYIFNQKIIQTSTVLEKKNGLLYTYLEQIISQLKIIQAYTAEQFSLHHYQTKVWDSLLTELKLYRYNILLTLANGLIIGTTYALVISIGTTQVLTGTLSVGLLMVFVFYLDNLVSPVISIIESLANFKQNLVQLHNTADIFDTNHQLSDSGSLTTLSNPTIRFSHVNLVDEDQHLLHDLTFSVKPGTLNVIIGESGSGKSTIFLLLLRFFNSWQGKITVGNASLASYQLSRLRQFIAYVPQETELFDSTIRDLIAFGHPTATQLDIERAARLACAATFILAKPSGYLTQVGEHGNLLSGGERQRLLLARAYLRDTPILLLDEIFSGQDKDTQAAMMQHLRSLLPHKTIFLITHTHALLKSQDHVIVMDKGQIQYQGAYQIIKKKITQRG